MTLFQSGNFTLHSGQKSNWKIECDSLTNEDWATLARLAVTRLPPFGLVIPVETGGVKFAAALSEYQTYSQYILVADDVLTSGRSLEEAMQWVRNKYRIHINDIFGVVAFDRSRFSRYHVFPIFKMFGE